MDSLLESTRVRRFEGPPLLLFVAYILGLSFFVWASGRVGVSFKDLIGGAPNMARLLGEMIAPDVSRISAIAVALLETFQIALVGTGFGILLGFAFSVLACRQLAPSRFVYWISRGFVALFRTVRISSGPYSSSSPSALAPLRAPSPSSLTPSAFAGVSLQKPWKKWMTAPKRCWRDGVDAIIARDDAARCYHQIPERLGDMVILGDRHTMFGDLDVHEKLDSNYRAHGSNYEMDLPMIIFNWHEKLPAAERFQKNKDLAHFIASRS